MGTQPTIPSFYLNCVDLNSGPHACMGNLLNQGFIPSTLYSFLFFSHCNDFCFYFELPCGSNPSCSVYIQNKGKKKSLLSVFSLMCTLPVLSKGPSCPDTSSTKDSCPYFHFKIPFEFKITMSLQMVDCC